MMQFFTLIHIAENKKNSHNVRVSNFHTQVELYLSCAKKLHQSLHIVGINLTIITNDISFLKNLSAYEEYLHIVEVNFKMSVPSGVNFYSAHYKVEVYKYLSQLNYDYVGIVDSDVLCVNSIPDCFKKIIKNRIPLYYNITDQVVHKYGSANIIHDKELLLKHDSIGMWAGGEFICGSPLFFNKLYTTIDNFKSDYFANYTNFCHQGDEMLSSSAIEYLIVHENMNIIDAGSLSLINRFWSYKPLHEQKSFDSFSEFFMLHLPSDKKFISSLDVNELSSVVFFKKYKKYYAKKSAFNYLIKLIKPLFKS